MDYIPEDIKKLIYSYVPCCKYCDRKNNLFELYKSEKYICKKCINRQQHLCIIF